jgi:Zn-dependent protease with chaperone function
VGEILVRQAILHGLIAAGFVEAVLAAWRIRSARARSACWFVALAIPFLVTPALLLTAPIRLGDHFATAWALFASARWDDVRIAGLGGATAAFRVLALLGTVLFLRDAIPFAARFRLGRREPAAGAPVPALLAAVVDAQARRLAIPVPALRVLRANDPVLFVRGLRRHTLVVSTRLLEQLPFDQLEAAIAHELAHVRSGDPAVGWLLMAARVAMFWNPAVQLVARAIAQEAEHRADAVAVRVAGVDAFAAAFDALSSHAAEGSANRGWRGFVARLHREHLDARAAALSATTADPTWLPVRLAAIALTLVAVGFFVV